MNKLSVTLHESNKREGGTERGGGGTERERESGGEREGERDRDILFVRVVGIL